MYSKKIRKIYLEEFNKAFNAIMINVSNLKK